MKWVKTADEKRQYFLVGTDDIASTIDWAFDPDSMEIIELKMFDDQDLDPVEYRTPIMHFIDESNIPASLREAFDKALLDALNVEINTHVNEPDVVGKMVELKKYILGE